MADYAIISAPGKVFAHFVQIVGETNNRVYYMPAGCEFTQMHYQENCRPALVVLRNASLELFERLWALEAAYISSRTDLVLKRDEWQQRLDDLAKDFRTAWRTLASQDGAQVEG